MFDKKRIIFCGTPKIAAECLKELLKNNNLDIVGVITQIDKSNSRNNKIVYNEVKQVCIENNLNILQYENINQHFDEINSLKPDLILTCAFGQFIGEKILNIPKYKCVNIHASLLPKLRGGAPIHWAIINGDKNSGITFMYMAKKMDSGNIIFQEQVTIDQNDTYDDLYKKLTNLAICMIDKYLDKLFDLNLISYEQDENKVTFGLNIKKEDEFIDFNNSAINIKNKIRGLYSKPCAKLIIDNENYKINECTILDKKSSKEPGTIIETKKHLIIATKDYDISISQIQPPNKKWMLWEQYSNGQKKFIVGNIIK